MKIVRSETEPFRKLKTCLIAYLALIWLHIANGAGSFPLYNFATIQSRTENQFNENQYIEAAIIKDAALMLVYSKTRTATAKIEMTVWQESYSSWEFQLNLNGTNINFRLPNELPVWEPARYAPVLAKMADALALHQIADSNVSVRPILTRLENPTTETMARISMDLSEKLKSHMFCAPLHEQAALLLASFGLRERLEPFDDTRWALCRLTAHLAFAHWLSDRPFGTEGAYALSTAYVLMNLETNALQMVHRLEADPQGDRAWNRALCARITRDYRPLRAVPSENLTRLEWAERIYTVSRTLGKEIGAKELAKYLQTHKEDSFDADLFFCIFDGWTPGSVGLGRSLYLATGFKLGLKDLERAWYNSQGSVLKLNDATELALRLNVPPGPLVHPEGQIDVLDWGAWAMQNQRRLAVIYLRTFEFIRDTWGLPKAQVADEKKAMDRVLQKLWLVSCLRVEVQPECLEDSFSTFAAHKAVVPIQAARAIVMAWYGTLPRAFSPDERMMQRLNAGLWINCAFPNGSYVSVDATMPFFQNALDVREMVQQMPYHLSVIRKYINERNPSTAECERLLRPLVDYNAAAASTLANLLPADQIQAKESIFQKLAGENPDFFLNLVGLFETSNLAKAATYFEQARTNGADPVGISNETEPFVDYYLSKGEKKKAEQIAIEAAEVGSSAGFEAMMHYCAKTHDPNRGLKAAQDCEERYTDKYEVLRYLDVVRKEQPNFHDLDKLYEQKLNVLFPSGVHPCGQPSSEGAPQAGVIILQNGRELRRNDVVIGVDGKRVGNVNQLRYLRASYTLRTGDAVNIPLVVFRNHAYQTINESTANIHVDDYVPSKPLNGATPIARISEKPSVPGIDKSSDFSQLRLTGISGLPPHRLAMVNGKTLAEGETASIKIAGRSLNVRCVSITQRSAAITIDGVQGSKELYLPD